MKQSASAVVLIASLVITGCSGCSSNKEGPRLATIKVSGKLTVDGKPQGNCMLTLSPTIADTDTTNTAANRTVSAIVDKDGNFSLRTYDEGDGAPPGTYKVHMTSDIGKMQPDVPMCKPYTVDIQKTADGKPVQIEIKLESSGEQAMGPGLGGSHQRQGGP